MSRERSNPTSAQVRRALGTLSDYCFERVWADCRECVMKDTTFCAKAFKVEPFRWVSKKGRK